MIKAYSFFELVLVIVIIGMLTLVGGFIPAKDRTIEGAYQVLDDIRYVRKLAMFQESFRSEEFLIAKREWYKAKWQLYFINSKATNYMQSYTVFLDKNGDGNANIGKKDTNKDREIAFDIIYPKKLMIYGQSGVIDNENIQISSRFNIEQKFGIKKVKLKGACSGNGSGTKIIFDEYGRLYAPLVKSVSIYDKLVKEACIVKLIGKNREVCIVIEPMTGYAFIPKFQDYNTQIITLSTYSQSCSSI